MAGQKANGAPAQPLTVDDVRTLLASDIAGGFGLSERDGMPGMLSVLRTPTPEGARIVRDKVLPLITGATDGRPQKTQVNGQEVVSLARPGAPPGASPSFAFAVSGSTVVFGNPPAVRAVFAEGRRLESTLAGVTAFADARHRLSSSAESFGWLDVARLLDFDPSSGRPADPVLSAIRGVGLGGAGTHAEMVLQLDRKEESLLSVLADAPSVNLRAASLVPESAAVFLTSGFEPARLFDFLVAQSKSKRQSFMLPNALDWARRVEPTVGMPTRDAFLASLGGQVSFAFGVTRDDAGAQSEGKTAARVYLLTLVEVVQPDIARRGLVRFYSGSPSDEFSESNYNGVIVSKCGAKACAVVDGIAIVGDGFDVRSALDARTANRTLHESDELASLRSAILENTLAAALVTPRVAEMFAAEFEPSPNDADFAELAPAAARKATYVATIQKEDIGLFLSGNSTAPTDVPGATVVGIAAAVAIPSLVRARMAANESAAIGTLRAFASAEATFVSRFERYASIDELASMGYVEAGLRDGFVRYGYRFRQVRVDGKHFEIAAEPATAMAAPRSFNVTDDYIIRYVNGARAPTGTSGKVLGSE